MKRKPLLFSFPLKTLTTFKAKNAEYTQKIHRIHAEYTQNALKVVKVKNEKKTLTLFLPLKNTQPPFKAKNAEYTQNTRRIHRECLKGGWVFFCSENGGS